MVEIQLRENESLADYRKRYKKVTGKNMTKKLRKEVEELIQARGAQSDGSRSDGMLMHEELNMPYVRQDDENILTPAQAAKMLNVSVNTLQTYARRGEIKFLVNPNEMNRKHPSRVYLRSHVDEFNRNRSIYVLPPTPVVEDSVEEDAGNVDTVETALEGVYIPEEV